MTDTYLPDVYRDRAHLIAFLAAIHDDHVIVFGGDPNEPDYPVIYIDTAHGQLSWHLSKRDLDLFPHVGHGTPDSRRWDGHTTAEKLDRLRALTATHIADMEEAQAAWEASGEAPHCSMVDIGGEEMRVQHSPDWTEQDRREMSQLVSAAKQRMAEEKAAERAEIEREVRAKVSAEILEERANLPEATIDDVIFRTAMVLAARVAAVGPTRAPQGAGDAHNPGREHGEGSGGGEASQGCSEARVACEWFHWIGQSFKHCDQCGRPAWDHKGEHRPGRGALFEDLPDDNREWEPGEADKIRAKWDR